MCLKLLFPPIHIQHTVYTHPVSVPIHHPSDKSSAVTSFETDIYIYRKYNNNIPGTYAVYSCMCSLGCFLEHGGGALGVFNSPV